jgi:single-strand DNA-binding protein
VPYSSINRVVLVGRLTRAPELKALPSGVAVCGLRLACDAVRKTDDGAYEQKPNFFSVSVFGAHAETVARYMDKGRLLAVDGRLDWHEWDTPEGERREAVEVLASRVQFLDGPGGGADGDGEEGAQGAAVGEPVGDLVF